jgi:hypothetical protein
VKVQKIVCELENGNGIFFGFYEDENGNAVVEIIKDEKKFTIVSASTSI